MSGHPIIPHAKTLKTLLTSLFHLGIRQTLGASILNFYICRFSELAKSTTATSSFPSVQLVEYALQLPKLLSSLAEFAFRRQALVVGQILGGFCDERVKIRCGLG